MLMKHLLLLPIALFTIISFAIAQHVVQHAPPGFDSLRTGITHGKIDTITYYSKTVDTKRKAVIYTPPGY